MSENLPYLFTPLSFSKGAKLVNIHTRQCAIVDKKDKSSKAMTTRSSSLYVPDYSSLKDNAYGRSLKFPCDSGLGHRLTIWQQEQERKQEKKVSIYYLK